MLVSVPSATALAVLLTTVVAKPFLTIESANVTHCDQVKFKYGGGTPPYTFTAMVALTPAQTLTFDSAEGDGEWQCLFTQENNGDRNQVTFILEDSTKTFATASPSYLIGANTTTCDAIKPPPFQFDWKIHPGASPAQCEEPTFTLGIPVNDGVRIPLPFSAIGVIPGGDVWREKGPPDTRELTIRLNIDAGNKVIYVVQNADKGQGGTSAYMDIIQAVNPTCLNADTRRGPASLRGKKKLSGGAIAGIVVGAVAGVLFLGAAAFFLIRRRRANSWNQGEHREFDVDDSPTPFTGGYSNTALQVDERNGPPMTHRYSEAHTHSSFLTHAQTETGTHSSSAGGDSSYGGVPRNSVVGKGAAAEVMQPMYRIQDDAGPVNVAPVIDMPPTYNPTWQETGSSAPLSSGSTAPMSTITDGHLLDAGASAGTRSPLSEKSGLPRH